MIECLRCKATNTKDCHCKSVITIVPGITMDFQHMKWIVVRDGNLIIDMSNDIKWLSEVYPQAIVPWKYFGNQN